jgi:Arc/MetJ family transcription regulator
LLKTALSCVSKCVKLSVIMATNLSIDPELLAEAWKIGGFSSKKDTVNQALKEFVQRRKQQEIIELFGNLPFDEDYDYKQGRK